MSWFSLRWLSESVAGPLRFSEETLPGRKGLGEKEVILGIPPRSTFPSRLHGKMSVGDVGDIISNGHFFMKPARKVPKRWYSSQPREIHDPSEPQIPRGSAWLSVPRPGAWAKVGYNQTLVGDEQAVRGEPLAQNPGIDEG